MEGASPKRPKHPVYRLVRAAWWVLALWLSLAILVAVIRDVIAR